MSDSRSDILNQIRAAKQSGWLPDASSNIPAADLPASTGGLEEFVAEVERLSGQVIRADAPADTVVELCGKRGWDAALCWAWDQIGCSGLEQAMSEAGIAAHYDGAPLDLAHLPVGITGAEAALAVTGTVVLHHGPGRNPLVSLLPAVHIVLLDVNTIYLDMPAYFASLPDAASHIRASSNLIFISGPSRTADIEQTLTLGVHGPRELIVVIY